MVSLRPVLSWGCCLLLGTFLMTGCGSNAAPDVPAGQYAAEVEGAVTDTLEGAVHHRTADGRLIGIELGERDGAGLSMELEPYPPDTRSYSVIDGELFGMERPGGTPGVMAFLTVDGTQFRATAGSLHVQRVAGETIGASFSFEMEGEVASGGDDAGVRVTGELNAPASRN